MKHFLSLVGIALAGFVAAAAIADPIVVLTAKNTYRQKYSYVQQHRSDIALLLLGHSEFECGINPHVMGDSVYDLAISARTLFYDVKIAEQFLPQMPNLRTVICPLHYNLHNVNNPYRNNLMREHIFFYQRYMHISSGTMPYGLLYRSSLLAGQSLFSINKPLADSLGWVPLADGPMLAERVNPPAQRDTAVCAYWLSRLAAACNAHGVRLIIVTCPYSDAYLQVCTDSGLATLDTVCRRAAARSPFEYHNYADDPAFRADSLYCNWNHLNRSGATLFTLRVKEDFDL